MKRISIILASAAVILGVAGYLGRGKVFGTGLETNAKQQPGSNNRTSGQRPGNQPLSVTGVRLAYEEFSETLTASGTLRAEEAVELVSEANGKVIEVNFNEGQIVRAGDVLLRIDDSSLLAELKRAEARKALAEFRERRLGKLVSEGGVSRLEYDEAKGQIDVLDAEIEIIRANLTRTRIRAPFDGIVGLRFVSIGTYVNPTTRIATLQGVSRLKVDFAVPERHAPHIQVGAPIEFQVSGVSRAYSGKVHAVEPRVDVGTRSVLIRAVCDNPDRSLLPGAYARVDFTLRSSNEALLVPTIAVISGLEERFLFIDRGGVAERVLVTTGSRTATHIQILSGVQPGQVVITSGLQQLRPGLPVTVKLGS